MREQQCHKPLFHSSCCCETSWTELCRCGHVTKVPDHVGFVPQQSTDKIDDLSINSYGFCLQACTKPYNLQNGWTEYTSELTREEGRPKWEYVMPHLHIRVSGEANNKANDERTNHIFAKSFVVLFASPFVALALVAVFRTRVKGDEWRFMLCVRTCECLYTCETHHSHRDRGVRMFVQVARRGTSTNV